ncbi:MAG: putative DegP protease [Planctomycetota bacterium]|jgi:S1-C subfamily serine protease
MQNYPEHNQGSPPKYLIPLVVISVLALLMPFILAGLYFTGRLQFPGTNEDARKYGNARTVVPRGNLAEDEKSTIELYNRSKQCVVHITTLANRRSAFSLNVQQVPEGTGSGFIWDEGGHIVTNFHVIQNADAAEVTFSDNSTYPARMVGYYADKDLAVLKVDAPKSKLKPIPVGKSEDLQVGQKVFAIGNPFGLDQTLTTGIISALGREIDSVTKRPIKNVIQSDAAINPGNSGGPLLDSAGLLIGVNTAIASSTGHSAGISFAIPVDEVNRVVPELIRHGKITKPALGVTLAPDHLAKQLGSKGVMVLETLPEGPAAKAGIKGASRARSGKVIPGDFIIRIDEQVIQTLKDLYLYLDSKKVGDTVKVVVDREGAEEIMEITLAPLQSLK